MTAELYREIVAVIDERVREIKVTREDFDRLEAAMARLAEAQARSEERLTRLEEAVEKLAQAQARTDQTVAKLAQAQARAEERLTRLEEAVAKSEERLTRLEEAVEKLAQAQARTDQTVERLVQAQARTEERVTRLEEAVERLVQAQARTEERVTRLEEAIERLAQAQARTEERLTRLEEAVEKLVQAQARFERTFETRLGALGARWGLDTEASFRQGMRAILEDVGFRVERYLVYDKEGKVFDHPDQVELDVVVRDGKLMLIEIKSSASRGDVAIFNRKVRFYEEREGTKAARRMLISPFVEEGARKLALALDTEIYTRADDLARSQGV
jgi:hypothetical protein